MSAANLHDLLLRKARPPMVIDRMTSLGQFLQNPDLPNGHRAPDAHTAYFMDKLQYLLSRLVTIRHISGIKAILLQGLHCPLRPLLEIPPFDILLVGQPPGIEVFFHLYHLSFSFNSIASVDGCQSSCSPDLQWGGF